jgi:hypothetical protein
MKELLESAEQLCRTVESQFEEIHTPKQVVLRDAVLRDIYRLRDAIKDASNSQYAKAVNEEKAPSTERFNADNVAIFSVFQRTSPSGTITFNGTYQGATTVSVNITGKVLDKGCSDV